MKKVLAVMLAGLFLLILSANAQAFDGQRKGFILGGGLGLGMTSYTLEFGTLTSDRFNKISFMTDFKIGYAPTDQVEIYYSSKGSWWSESGTTFLHSYGTAALSYYLLPQSPTFYLTGGIGFSSLAAPFENNTTTETGFGFFGGAGYEFIRHFAIEANLMYGQPGSSGDTFKGLVPRVIFVATAF